MNPPRPTKYLPGGGVEFPAVVSAGARRSGVTGAMGEALKVSVQAPAVHNRANAEVRAVIAAWLAVPARDVVILYGITTRHKWVGVAGVSKSVWQALLASLARPGGASSI